MKLTAMDKGLVSRVLNDLGKRGWVEQVGRGLQPSGLEVDQNRRRIGSATAAGVARTPGRLQSHLTAQEHELLLQLLERLFQASERLRAEEAKALPPAGRKSTQRRAFSGS